jgi:cyclophilin family peptidyl-prolyl cis-trans isomerase
LTTHAAAGAASLRADRRLARRALSLVAALTCAPGLGAQRVSAADSALVAQILMAEEHRDTSSAAYDAGLRSGNARVRTLARRALERSRDPLFAWRDSLPPLPPPPAYDEPEWRLRLRRLGTRNDNCADLRAALADSAWPVRARGAALVTASCGDDPEIIRTLTSWLDLLPPSAARRAGLPSWHSAAHALVALTRTGASPEARRALPRLAASPIPAVRVYAARAAAALADTAALLRLAADADDNVKEAGITGLQRVAGHSNDAAIVPALGARGYQAVRAAAVALRGSALRGLVLDAAIAAATRLRSDSSETSRDARRALVDRIAEFASAQDWPRIAPLANDFDCAIVTAVGELATRLGQRRSGTCAPLPILLPPDAVRLALGAEVRLRVVLADSSGGGSFVVRLRGDIAPVMAARVLALVRQGYYAGLTWHRVEHDFVAQGGGGGNEYIGHPRFFRDELGNVPHARGTIGMSTRGHDTGDAQWFFNLRENLRLNRDYTVFAEVADGIAVVDGILEGDVIARIEVMP